jgi:glycosyltransferase involved in cell wall biosynthesis
MPLLSVVIPTLNRYEDLKNTLTDLTNQQFSDFEVIVIDQTDDPASEDSFKFESLNIVWQQLTVKSASVARNIGLLHSRSDIVLFLDDDVIIRNRQFLYNHYRHYADASVPGVAGCIMEPDGVKRMDRHKWSYRANGGWLFFPRNYGLPARVSAGGSGNLSVRRQLAIEVGGMDENYEKGAHREEADFCLRVVKRAGLFVYDPEADLIHIGSPTGGIRSWSKPSNLLKAQHNFDGAFYFMFRQVALREWPVHMMMNMRFFFYDKALVKRPDLFVVGFYRMIKAIRRAWKLSSRPKYITLN